MLKVSLFFPLLLLLSTFSAVFAQEAFAPEQLYFQGEVIRKVSVGADGIWVIKGTDSTGLARVDFQGGIKDYSTALGFQKPLIGVVGKSGESVVVAAKQHGVFLFDGNSVRPITQNFDFTNPNDLQGSPTFTRIATKDKIFESYDNKSFYTAKTLSPQSGYHEPIILAENSKYNLVYNRLRNADGQVTGHELHVSLSQEQKSSGSGEFWAMRYPTHEQIANPIHAVHASGSSTYDAVPFLGNNDGLFVSCWVTFDGNTSDLDYHTFIHLKDTAVFSLKGYKNQLLVGTAQGLWSYSGTTRGTYGGRIVAIPLQGEYVVYDIAVQEEEQIIWLATNKGLLKVKDHYKPLTSDLNNSLLWSHSFAGQKLEKANSTVSDAAGNIYQSGYFEGDVSFGSTHLKSRNSKDFYLAKLNSQGEEQWVRTLEHTSPYGYRLDEEGIRLRADYQGNVYVLCKLDNKEGTEATVSFGNGTSTSYTGTGKAFLLKYNSSGELQWTKELSGFLNPLLTQLGVDEQGILYFSCKLEVTNPFNLPPGRGVIKFDADGNQVWGRSYPIELDRFNLGKDGKFYLSGYFKNSIQLEGTLLESTATGNLAIFHLSAEGTPIWGSMVKGFEWYPEGQYSREIGTDAAGNTYLAGITKSTSTFGGFTTSQQYGSGSTHYFLTKLNNQGTFEWLQYENGFPYGLGLRDMVVDAEGNSFITGVYEHLSMKFGGNIIEAERDGTYKKRQKIYVAKFASNGTSLWAHALPEVQYYEPNSMDKSLALHPEGIVVAASQLQDVRLNDLLLDKQGPISIFLAAISNTFTATPFGLVQGKSFVDANGNQQYDEGEQLLEGNLVKAEPGPVYTTTDFGGNYSLKLAPGNYTINQVVPRYSDKVIRQTSPTEPYAIQLSSSGETKGGYDFAHAVEFKPTPKPEYIRTPYVLDFDVTSTQFRRCFTSATTVVVRNIGKEPAENVDVVLEYPEHLIPVASNIPWTRKNNNLLTFSIPRIPVNENFRLSVKDSVACGDESIRNLQQCVKAYLNFTDPTNIDPLWDKSDIELAAECKDNGFVRLTMKNSGTGAMADSALFNIYLEQQKVYTGKYKLATGETQSLNLLANGKPLLFQAVLTPMHPQKKSVSLRIEGCTSANAPIISRSYVSTLPADTLHENQKIICLPITDSFDPNDKLTMPTGITDNHNILGTEYLTYTIRFQNTGTAPAINIRIVDVLDQQLDIATLRIDATSHPVSFERQGNTLNWRFIKIYLPDSTSNEPGSHGFVKFRIKPKQGLAKGAIIRNAADIYFDYNSPIRTNEVFHTIGLPELLEDQVLVVQPCNTQVSLLEEQNQTVILCGDESFELSRLVPRHGHGIWKVVKGQATLEDPYDPQTTVRNLSLGENELVWEVTYCDQQVSSTVTLIREPSLAEPEVIQPAPHCEGDLLPVFQATATTQSEILEWYGDEALTQLLAQGPSFQLTDGLSQTLYVIKRNSSCSSSATKVHFAVHPKPTPPQAASVESCIAIETPLLTAEGSNIRWYADAERQQLLAEGTTYSPATKNSTRYYVTQSSNYCESHPTEVSFTAKHYDPTKAFIANVITPNEDDTENRYFYLKEFDTQECLGSFIGIRIYNRWGKQVFSSAQADFKWDASQLPSGVYYYRMDYVQQKFQGAIQVMR